MRKGSHPKKAQTQAKLLHAAVVLFLKKGYQETGTAEISQKAGFSSGMFFNAFPDKESVLLALVDYMFSDQFSTAELLLKPGSDPVLLYSAETALQLHITELSEPLRDLYVSAYSLPSTSETIYKKTAAKLSVIFGQTMPLYDEKDFYECEIASAGIIRAYMAKPCDIYFTIDQKIRRFLEAALKIYNVPPQTREEMTARVLAMDLRDKAEQLIALTVERAKDGFELSQDSIQRSTDA